MGRRRGPSVCASWHALAFDTFADQAAVDSNGVTETGRDDEAEGNCASGGSLHVSCSGPTHRPTDGDPRTQNVLTDSVAGLFTVE